MHSASIYWCTLPKTFSSLRKVWDFVRSPLQGMKLDGKSYYSYTELDNWNILFPLEYSVKKELLMQSAKYTKSGFGGEVAFSLKGKVIKLLGGYGVWRQLN